MLQISKLCPICRNQFESYPYQHKIYCSKDCYLKHHTSKKQVVCKGCGGTFEIGKLSRRTFCSQECHRKHMVKKRDEGKRIWWQCPICKKKFWWQRNKAKSRKYCSPECQAIGASQRLRGKRRKACVKKREVKVYKRYDRITDRGVRKILHRHVMEEHIGRDLTRSETVHHVDMDSANNSLSNLYLCVNESEHMKAHMSLFVLVKPLLLKGVIEFSDGKYKLNGNQSCRNANTGGCKSGGKGGGQGGGQGKGQGRQK